MKGHDMRHTPAQDHADELAHLKAKIERLTKERDKANEESDRYRVALVRTLNELEALKGTPLPLAKLRAYTLDKVTRDPSEAITNQTDERKDS